jgi:hypothetical protein
MPRAPPVMRMVGISVSICFSGEGVAKGRVQHIFLLRLETTLMYYIAGKGT